MKIRNNLFLFLLLVSRIVLCQQLPNVVPPSPQTAALMKYIDYPVNYNTGLTDISIPLYTIKAGNIEVPIVLRYNPQGIKPYEVDRTNIGSGWTLEVGGMVSRTVMGLCDEHFQRSPLSTLSFIPQDNVANMYALDDVLVGNRNKDSENDQFSYSFCGQSGKFAISNNGDGTFRSSLYPYKPYKIDVQTGPGNYNGPTFVQYYREITGIDITNDAGNLYKFGHYNSEVAISTAGDSGATGWFLEEIHDAEHANFVTFSYDNIPQRVYTYVPPTSPGGGSGPHENYVTVTDNGKILTCSLVDMPQGPFNIFNNGTSYGGAGYDTKIISSVHFNGGSVTFTANPDKTLIQKMVVYDDSNHPVETVIFNQESFISGDPTHIRLNSIQMLDNAAQTPVENYQFTYNMNYTLTDDHYAIDNWGYCRGLGDNFSTQQRYIQIISDDSIEFPSLYGIPMNYPYLIGNDNLYPNEDYAQRFILQQIKYPTGGTTHFTYEMNQYYDTSPINGTSVYSGGGMRIKQINSINNNGNSILKTYEYDPGFIELSLFNEQNYTRVTYHTDVMAYDGYCPTYYTHRTRTFYNGWMKNLGPNNVHYNKVTEYTGTSTVNNGKIVYNYTYGNPTFFSAGAVDSYRDWGNGLLTNKETYKSNPDGSYTKVQSVNSNYGFTNLETLNSFNGYLVNTYGSPPTLTPYTSFESRPSVLSWPRTSYGDNLFLTDPCVVHNYNILTGAYYLTSTVEKDYNGSDNTEVTTSYQYANPNHFYPTSIIKTRSNGEKSVTNMAYVDENSTSPVYAAMKGLNILAPVIQKDELIRNTANVDRPISSVKTDYNYWSPNVYKPITVSTNNAGGSFEPRVQFLGYDTKGNVLSVAKANGPKTNYIYGYGGMYPIAKIDNADYAYLVSVLGGASNVEYFKNIASPTDAQVTSFLSPLRNSLYGALVNTYTYTPLVGMSSATDPKGQTTYYQYDSFNRLRTIKDKNGNIVKAFCYNYKGEQTNCYVPQPQVGQGVYARIEVGSQSATFSGDSYNGETLTYADISVHFYSDAACTSPLTLTSATTIAVANTVTTTNNYGYPDYTNSLNYDIPAGVSSHSIGYLATYDDFYSTDGYSYYYYGDDVYTYNVVSISGSTYIPEPCYIF